MTARNLPTPLKNIFPIQIGYKQDDTIARAKKIVEEERQRVRPAVDIPLGKDGKIRIRDFED